VSGWGYLLRCRRAFNAQHRRCGVAISIKGSKQSAKTTNFWEYTTIRNDTTLWTGSDEQRYHHKLDSYLPRKMVL
jgi:hypothetical protein